MIRKCCDFCASGGFQIVVGHTINDSLPQIIMLFLYVRVQYKIIVTS